MIEVNLKPQIKVVYPHGKRALGRFAVNNRDLVRRKLLIQSFTYIRDFLFKNVPELIPHRFDYEPMQTIEREGFERDMRRLTRIELVDLRGKMAWEGVSKSIDYLNELCCDKKINGHYVEFILDDLPGLPRSIVRMLPRKKPIDKEAEDFLSRSGTVTLFFKIMNDLKPRIYTESELRQLVSEKIGEVSRLSLRAAIEPHFHHFFRRVMRPYGKENEERLYFIYGTGFKAYSKKTAPLILEGEKKFSVVLREEADELVKEGRIIPVLSGEKHPIYFTPNALREWESRGDVMKVEMNDGQAQYIETFRLGRYIEKVKSIPKAGLSASRVFLDYLRERRLDQKIKRSHPYLAAAIEALQAAPKGSDAYFEAARIAAERGASEESIAFLLLQKELSSRSSKEEWDFIEAFRERFIASNLEIGLTIMDGFDKEHDLESRMRHMNHIQGLDLRLMRVRDGKDIGTYLGLFSDMLGGNKEHQLEYFSTVLGRLMHTQVGKLKKWEVGELRVIIAPLAEKCGYLDLAAMIRNEVFRIAYNREYRRIKVKIEEALGLTYTEMELHLNDMEDFMHEVLKAAGINKEDYKISSRTKFPYSVWEKMESSNISEAAHVYDILGLNIITSSDSIAGRIAGVIGKVMPEILDRTGIAAYMRRAGIPRYKDQIIKPTKSGFSAITLRRLSELDLPIEVQVTTFDRDKVNTQGKAAHWKHKVLREIKFYYGIDVEGLEPAEGAVVFYGEWKGGGRKTFKGGLEYKVFKGKMKLEELEGFLGMGPGDELFYWDLEEYKELRKMRRIERKSVEDEIRESRVFGSRTVTFPIIILKGKKSRYF